MAWLSAPYLWYWRVGCVETLSNVNHTSVPPSAPEKHHAPPLTGPKHDIKGFWPGMTHEDFTAQTEDSSLKCEPEKDHVTDCKGILVSAGEWRFTFTAELSPTLLREVAFYFKSGNDAVDMANVISDQYGMKPTQWWNRDKLHWSDKPAKNKPDDRALGSLFSSIGMRFDVARWDLPNQYVLRLEGAENYVLTLTSSGVEGQEQNARTARLNQEEVARRQHNTKPKF
jgi:hypothetical protein